LPKLSSSIYFDVMSSSYPFSLKIRNFKCFGSEEQGFDKIKSLNLILGRNNSGKSTLLDFLAQINHYRELQTLLSRNRDEVEHKDLEVPRNLWHKDHRPEILVAVKLTRKNLIDKILRESQGIDQRRIVRLFPQDPKHSHQSYSQSRDLGLEISNRYADSLAVLKTNFSLASNGYTRRILRGDLIGIESQGNDSYLGRIFEASNKSASGDAQDKDYNIIFKALQDCAREELESSFGSFWDYRIFKRIYPDRNILAEEDDIKNLEVDGSGKGVTNIIQNFYNKEELNRSLVEEKILSDLNLIFRGDAYFTRILPRRKSDGQWEIALEEEHKGLIPLSQSGSSLKTVMIILVYLYLVPSLEKKDLSQYAFLIEELENNLHPSLLRRLLSYIADRAKEDGCIFFMATHSSIAIDMFSHDEDAQIIHVTHNGESSYAETVTTPLNGLAILDDLGVKASDLLQANGIIWVEGPSDVIYIDKWLEMYCRENREKQFRRGIDYEFQMFGGTLLDSLCFIKHGLASEDEERKKLVEMFSFSRNAFVVIDSDAVKIAIEGRDKTVDKSKFKSAKKFIKSQFEELNAKGLNLGLWYKAGNTQIRTLEDYLDADTVAALKSRKLTKKIYAQTATDSWSDSKRLDEFPHGLKKEIKTLYELIKKWNR
jgi:putative ATP-dependent endonuclease of OLD family